MLEFGCWLISSFQTQASNLGCGIVVFQGLGQLKLKHLFGIYVCFVFDPFCYCQSQAIESILVMEHECPVVV